MPTETKYPYGFCPTCGCHGKTRERRPNGNDTCSKGHVYASSKAIGPKEAQQVRRRVNGLAPTPPEGLDTPPENFPPPPEGLKWKRVLVSGQAGLSWALVPLPPAEEARVVLNSKLTELVSAIGQAGWDVDQGSQAAERIAKHFLAHEAQPSLRAAFVAYMRTTIEAGRKAHAIDDHTPVDDQESYLAGKAVALSFVENLLEGLLRDTP